MLIFMILHYILHQFCILQNWWLPGVCPDAVIYLVVLIFLGVNDCCSAASSSRLRHLNLHDFVFWRCHDWTYLSMRPHCLKPTKSALWHLRMHHLLYIWNLLSELMVRVEQQVGRSWSWTWGFGCRRLVESSQWRCGRRSIRSKKRCKVCSFSLWCFRIFLTSYSLPSQCEASSSHYLKVVRPKSLSLRCAS